MKEKKETLTERCNRQTQTIAKQQQSIEALQNQDRQIRSQFTTVLNSSSKPGEQYWGRSSQQTAFSWEEIFFQIGSISARLFNSDTKSEIDDLREAVNNLQTKQNVIG